MCIISQNYAKIEYATTPQPDHAQTRNKAQDLRFLKINKKSLGTFGPKSFLFPLNDILTFFDPDDPRTPCATTARVPLCPKAPAVAWPVTA